MQLNVDIYRFALIPHDAVALRSTLLVAAVHYSWNLGNLRDYEETFYLHKIDTMRVVNEWLRSPGGGKAKHCARQIMTLFLTEVSSIAICSCNSDRNT